MSVVLPEPFGPMRPEPLARPSRAGSPVSAVKPPKRLASLVDRQQGLASSAASAGAAPGRGCPRARATTKATSTTPDDEQVHLGGDRHGGELLGGAEQDGADHRARPSSWCRRSSAWRARSRRSRGRRRSWVDEGDVVGERRAGHAEQEAADSVVAKSLSRRVGTPHALGRLLVVAQRGQPAADPGALDEPRHEHRDDGEPDHDREQERHVAAERRPARPDDAQRPGSRPRTPS